MIFNRDFAEQYKFFDCISPVDLSAAANVGKPMPVSRPGGDANSIKIFDRITALVYKGAGTAGDDVEITVRQAKTHAADISGADPLNFATIHSRSGNSIGDSWVLEASDTSSWTSDTNAEKDMVLAIDIPAINIKDGNAVVAVSISQAGSAGNAQFGGCVLLGHNFASNNRFVEDHTVVMAGPSDLKDAGISRTIDWSENAGSLRTITFAALTGPGTVGQDSTATFEATDDADNYDMVWKRMYLGFVTSGVDYNLIRFDNVTNANFITGGNAAENSTIWVTDYEYLDIPAKPRRGISGGINVGCALSQVAAVSTEAVGSQPAVVLGITSGARYQ